MRWPFTDMRRLALDYASARHFPSVPYVVLAAAIVVLGDSGLRYRALQAEIKAKETRLAQAKTRPLVAKMSLPPVGADEYAFARQTASRLSMPWERLFRALEAAATDRVALLAIEPDIESRTVIVSGEAKDYLAVLSYVASLADRHDAFSKVYLQRHEIRAGGSERPVAFSVSATWLERR
jgi:hypothetical protein